MGPIRTKEPFDELHDYVLKRCSSTRADEWSRKYSLINSLVYVFGLGFVPRQWVIDQGLDPTKSLTVADDFRVPSWECHSSIYEWRLKAGHKQQVWFAWFDTYGTGEGRTMQFRAFWAWDEADALLELSSKAGALFSMQYELSTELPDNSVTEYLVTPAMRDYLANFGRGSLDVFLSHHVNFS